MKRLKRFYLIVIVFSTACSFSPANGSNADQRTEPDVDPSTTVQAASNDRDPLPSTLENESPLDAPPTEYRITILSQLLIAEEGGITYSGVKCGKMLAFAAGLAVNEFDIPLFSPDIYIEAFDGDQLVDRFRLFHGIGKIVLPGERTIFTSDRPKCKDFSSVTSKGFGLPELRYEIALYAEPIPDHYSLTPYRDMEIVSISEQRREDGTVITITVANTGSLVAYPYLNYVYFDVDGKPVDANVIFVYTDAEPWDALYPGTQGTVTLFMEPEGVEYDLFLLGETPKDGG